MQAMFDIDVIKHGSYGKPAATPERPVTQNSYDYALFLEFDSVDDHDAYQTHPDHKIFIDSFAKWFKTVKIFDTEIA